MTQHSENDPITQAICRIVAEAMMGESPASMEGEIEAIVGEWRAEPDIDHDELSWRLATLRNEMSRGIESGKKHLPIYAVLEPSVIAKMRGLQEGLIHARQILTRLRAQTLA